MRMSDIHCSISQSALMSMIETIVAAAKDAIEALGWRLVKVDQTGRGTAVFTNDADLRLIFEIGLWYPPNAHHLDDEPGIILSVQDEHSPKVQVPYLSQEPLPDLFWSSSQDDVRKQTLMMVRDFENNLLALCSDRRRLYNYVLDRWLKEKGIVDEALFRAIKDALASDQATSVSWAERKLSILRQRIPDGGVFAFDPSLGHFRRILNTDEFDTYVSTNLGRCN
jgi:hypothetical protein